MNHQVSEAAKERKTWFSEVSWDPGSSDGSKLWKHYEMEARVSEKETKSKFSVILRNHQHLKLKTSCHVILIGWCIAGILKN